MLQKKPHRRPLASELLKEPLFTGSHFDMAMLEEAAYRTTSEAYFSSNLSQQSHM
jgi:hypothetical protein